MSSCGGGRQAGFLLTGRAPGALSGASVSEPIISERTRALAQRSVNCVLCERARRRQAGLAFWLVKTFEGLCPFCRAYEKVYGRKSHEAVAPAPSTPERP
jgi:hypothetical protein